MQKTLLGDPAPLFDQLSMHQCDLPGRATEADAAQLEPVSGGFGKGNRLWGGTGIDRYGLVLVMHCGVPYGR